MNEKIKVAIAGYGNIGRGVEAAIAQNKDMILTTVFTRRNPESIQINTVDAKVMNISDAASLKNDIDVVILCGGSATDLPVQGPEMAALFNTVDSFDTHAKIPEYFKSVNDAASQNNNTSIISVGWDPGLFSINRLYGDAILPNGGYYTFWGKGVSQGHSDAIRRVKGVKNGIQYTVPVESAVEAARSGNLPELTTRQKHTRLCYVVAEDGADLAEIEKTIKEMPNYFSDYDTTVNFISEEELKKNHSKMAHGGFVIHSGSTNNGANNHVIEYSLKLNSNPEFTGSVLVAYARAAYRLAQKGEYGAKTVFDIAPAMLSPKTGEILRNTLL
ncbi:diaminopimelate dehydrogenase [Clostridium sp. MD294]|uniref:diaminopimelate dehydrogenase n=1 Tax=Clostridium sp. MD294 TaxID=97138 RepID=UPI0002CC9C8F|nr:diaminopimelate dehydrogenase [Clostridium sp. MD294]NDO45738.1 diaminopimelate dehydrogenase [Clostridium sp. MD294]USF30608.1 Meso-diaminopimelate D-dehydrogenase [Clostridium sp. MD294]